MIKHNKLFEPTIVVQSVMAKSNNLPAKKYKAGERTVTRLHFKWNAGEDGGAKYIDIAKALSQVNRRAYRQGLYYYVSKATFSNNGVAYCQVNTLMDNWITKAAWTRGFKMWSKMNRKATQDMPGLIYPKYHDFKVMMHPNSGTTLNAAYGNQTSSTEYSSDDWVISDFVTEDPVDADPRNTDTFTSHMLGAHTGSAGSWTSVGLIRSLNDVWRYDPAEGVPSLDADADTDPIANLFDDGDNFDDVRLNLDQDNDEPPYNHDVMPGASSTDEQTMAALMRTSAGAGAYVSAPGFCAPFGLLEVFVTDFGAGESIGDVELTLDLVPGTYHGVYAERVL